MVNPEFCWVGQSCFAHWTPSQPSQPSQRKLFETTPKSLQFTCCFKLKHGETAKSFCRDESMSLVSLVWFKARTSWSRTSTTSCLPCTTIQQLLPWLGVKFWQGMNISQVALEELKTGDIKKKVSWPIGIGWNWSTLITLINNNAFWNDQSGPWTTQICKNWFFIHKKKRSSTNENEIWMLSNQKQVLNLQKWYLHQHYQYLSKKTCIWTVGFTFARSKVLGFFLRR